MLTNSPHIFFPKPQHIHLWKALGRQWLKSDAFASANDLWQSYNKPRQRMKKKKHHFADKGPHSQSSCFSSSHVWMWELVHKEGWALRNWCFQTVVLEKSLKNLLDCKEIKPANPKRNLPWIFIGRTDAKDWPPDMKSWLTRKDPDARKDWGLEEKGAPEDEMAR